MYEFFYQKKSALSRKLICSFVALTFSMGLVLGPTSIVQAQYVSNLPQPGTMVLLSPAFAPPVLKGMTLHPENPLHFDFIVDRGQDKLSGDALKNETQKLLKYFLAAMTIPDDDSWVNLSPYEGDRIIPDMLGSTDMGKQMLEQDYLLKQLSASLTNPQEEIGKKFWDTVYKKAYEKFGTTAVPINTFNKVWIVPDRALILEEDGYVFIGETHLKVMLDEDYASIKANLKSEKFGTKNIAQDKVEALNNVSSEVVRQVILPELEKEINEGKNFTAVRQIYNSVILAAWYKQNLKNSLLGRVYVDKSKIAGVDIAEKDLKQKVYEQYLAAFRKGVYNLIKEDYDLSTKETLPRKYFSGGFDWKATANAIRVPTSVSEKNKITRGIEQAIDEGSFTSISTRMTEGKEAPTVTALAAVASSPVNADSHPYTKHLKAWFLDQIGIARASLHSMELNQDQINNQEKVLNEVEIRFLGIIDVIAQKVIAGKINPNKRQFVITNIVSVQQSNGKVGFEVTYADGRTQVVNNKSEIPQNNVPIKVLFFPTAANPVHWDHIISALQAMADGDIDLIILKPAGNEPKPTLLPYEKRAKMLEPLVEAMNPFVSISLMNMEKTLIGEENFKVLSEFNSHLPNLTLGYLVGADHRAMTVFKKKGLVAIPLMRESAQKRALVEILRNKLNRSAGADVSDQEIQENATDQIRAQAKALGDKYFAEDINALFEEHYSATGELVDPLEIRRDWLLSEIKRIDSDSVSAVQDAGLRTRYLIIANSLDAIIRKGQGREGLINNFVKAIVTATSENLKSRATFNEFLRSTSIGMSIEDSNLFNKDELFDFLFGAEPAADTIGHLVNSLLEIGKAIEVYFIGRANEPGFGTADFNKLMEKRGMKIVDVQHGAVPGGGSSTLVRDGWYVITPITNYIIGVFNGFYNFAPTPWLIRTKIQTYLSDKNNRDFFVSREPAMILADLSAKLGLTVEQVENGLGYLQITRTYVGNQPRFVLTQDNLEKLTGDLEGFKDYLLTYSAVEENVSKPVNINDLTKKYSLSNISDAKEIMNRLGFVENPASSGNYTFYSSTPSAASSAVRQALTPAEIVTYSAGENQWDFVKASEVYGSELVRDSEQELTTDYQINFFERQTQLRGAILALIFEYSQGQTLDFNELKDRLDKIHTASIDGYGGQSGLTITTAGYHSKANVDTYIELMDRGIKNFVSDEFQSKSLEEKINYIAEFQVQLAQRENIFSAANYSYHMAWINAMLRLSGLTGIAHQDWDKQLRWARDGVGRERKTLEQASGDVNQEVLAAIKEANPEAFGNKIAAGTNAAQVQAGANVAASPVGGIDFDPSLLNLQIKRNGKGVPLPLPQQNLENINIDGLYPVIINMQPATIQNFPFLLSKVSTEKEPELAVR
jgi:hypothetical protein